MTKAWFHQAKDLARLPDEEAWMLGYDMGCGKSFVVVALTEMLDMRRVLIVCPKSVGPVWPEQFEEHGQQNGRMIYDITTGTAAKRKKKLDEALESQFPIVLILNYDMVWRINIEPRLMAILWDMIVCDESHRIKSHKARCSRSLWKLGQRATRRLCLTGTPMENPMDLFAQYRFLDANIFGVSFLRYKHQYAVMGGFAVNGKFVQIVGYRNLDDLQAKFRSISTVVRKQDVLDLPSFIHQRRYVDLSAESAAMHQQMRRHMIAEYKDGTITAANALVKLTRLQQITSGYAPVERDDVKTLECISDDKANEISNLMQELPESEPLVVFVRFTADGIRIRREAADLGRKAFELSGAQNQLAEWQKDDTGSVLVAQIQSGGVGVSMVRACYGVYYSQTLSNLLYKQSLARLHRPGQTRPVTFIHILARGTVDERVYGMLGKKEEIVRGILEGPFLAEDGPF